MIPEPLSAVAAEMVSEHDRLLREREDFAVWRTREIRRLNVIRISGYVVLAGAIVSLLFQLIPR